MTTTAESETHPCCAHCITNGAGPDRHTRPCEVCHAAESGDAVADPALSGWRSEAHP